MNVPRRTVLRGLSGACLSLPFLESAQRAFGAAEVAPKRALFVFTSTGSVRKNWKPSVVGMDPPPSVILKPLATPELKPYLTALSGINASAGGGSNTHLEGMATCLTASQNVGGYASGISIDTALGSRFKGVTPFEALQFGVKTRKPPNGLGDSFITYRERAGGGVEGVYPEDNPVTMYGKLFSNTAAGGSPVLAQQLARNRSVLDFVAEEHKRVGAKLNGPDRARLEEHATMVRGLEQSMVANSMLTCAKPAQGIATLTDAQSESSGSFRAVSDMNLDMIAAAFACDQTRVATLQYTTGESGLNWDDVDKSLNFRATAGRSTDNGVGAGSATSWWHGISHMPDTWDPTKPNPSEKMALEVITNIQIWFSEQIASLALRMKKYKDKDGKSVLDNTVIFWTSEVAQGDHGRNDMPFTVVGNLGGTLKSNIHLAFNGRQHGDVFATIGTAMGLTGFKTFGRAGYTQGPLTEWLK